MENINVKSIQLHLKLAEKSDLPKFRQIGTMYFVWSPERGSFLEQPSYIHRDTNLKDLYSLFLLERIYIPMNYFDVKYLEQNYAKINDYQRFDFS